MGSTNVYYGWLGYEGKVLATIDGFEVTLLPIRGNRAKVIAEAVDPDRVAPPPAKVAAYVKECEALVAGKTIAQLRAVRFPPAPK